MILSCNHISKAFGTDQILSDVSFHVEDQEKAAIVGINGAGKSTLLKIIVGELSPDTGESVLSRGKTLGYLAQHQDLESGRTIYEELKEVKRPIIEMEEQIRSLELQMRDAVGEALEQMLSTYSRLNHTFELENGYAWKSEIVGVLKGLGFNEDEFDKQVSTLSGGQKTRVSLGRLLLSKPDVILLETIHVRKLLESEAAAQAAKNIRKDEIDDLEKALITTIQEIRKLKTGQDNDFFQADAKFHRLILRASHNPVFEQCLEAMPNIMSLHQYWSLKMTTPMDEVVTYHCSIFENILIHNEAGAREAMMAHLSRVEELLARKVPEEKEGESPVPKVWYTT